MKYKYALITDNSLQWFSFIIALSESDDILESYHIDSKMNNEYLTNLFNRQTSFFSKMLTLPTHQTDWYSGIWISEYDFLRVRKMTELWPALEEYERLGKLK